MNGLGATLTNDERFQEALSYFPDCYSESFDACVQRRNTTRYPNCDRLNELWTEDKSDPVYQKLEVEVDKVPFCEPSSSLPKYAVVATAVLASFAAGFFLGKRL
jgi:hypothetical protein